MVDNARLRLSYSWVAPFYDLFLEKVTEPSRRRSVDGLALGPGEKVLVPGIGTGLDIPTLPEGTFVVGVDLTPAMLLRARRRAARSSRRVLLVIGDAQRLPFRKAAFDAALLHLVLAIVPRAALAFAEAVRCVRPGGRIGVFDKFVRKGTEPSLARKLADGVVRPVTGLLTRFEDLLAVTPRVKVEEDRPDLLLGFFRRIRLTKAG